MHFPFLQQFTSNMFTVLSPLYSKLLLTVFPCVIDICLRLMQEKHCRIRSNLIYQVSFFLKFLIYPYCGESILTYLPQISCCCSLFLLSESPSSLPSPFNLKKKKSPCYSLFWSAPLWINLFLSDNALKNVVTCVWQTGSLKYVPT